MLRYSKEIFPERRSRITGKQDKEPQNKAAARVAAAVSIVRGGRISCNFAGRQQLAEGAPVSSMPFCGLRNTWRQREEYDHG